MNRFEGDGEIVKKPAIGISDKCRYGILIVAVQETKETKKQFLKLVSFANDEIIDKIQKCKVNDYIIFEGRVNCCTHTKNGVTQKDAEIVLTSLQTLNNENQT